jgi:hypothetical protein
MAVNLSPYGGVGAQFLDNSGNVLTGGKIFTYAAGTTTNQVTYTTSAGNIPHSNPIILDASGRVPSGGEIWLTDGLSYKFILRDANDVLIATYDNVTGINSNFVAFTNQQEIQTATAGQTVFNLTTMTYQPATNSLTVFVDGVNQYGPGAQYAYVETDSDTVTFVNGLHVGAEVKFTTSQLNSNASQSNAFQVSYTPPFTGSVATNVGDKLAQTISVMDFGAVGDGVTDDTTAIQNAINAAETLSVNTSRASLSPLLRSSFPLVMLYFPAGKYLVSSQLDVGAISSRYHWYGDNALIFANAGTMAVDYLIKATGAYDAIFENIAFGSTEIGCLEFDCPNVSSAMVLIKECNFVGNTDATTHGTAIKYTNQSSILTVKDCLFNNVQYPFQWVSGDFTTFEGCWFDCASLATYSNDTGYFNSVGATLSIENCLFAGGPGASGTRIAYINCTNDIELTVRKTRVTFETGGGPLINWQVPFDAANGSFVRSGFTIDDCLVSPRGQNETYGATTATPLVRLYTMPNRMHFANLSWRNSVQGVLGVAPTTTLTALYASAQTQIASYTQTSYSYVNCVGNSMYFVPTSDLLVHKQWLELFNIFDYGFQPVTAGSEQTNKYQTFFTGNSFANVFQVSGWVDMSPGAQFSKQWLVSVTYNASTGNYAFVTNILDTVGAVNSRNVTLTPKFYNIGTAAYTDTIAITEDLTDYLLAFDITSISAVEFICDPLYVRPMQAFNKVNGFFGTPRQSF